MHDQFRSNSTQKTYLALLHGAWSGGDQSVDLPLEVTQRKNGERHVIVSESGKAALSHFSLRQNYADFCLMNVKIETGRTHQIRVHAAELGHPVVGDERYAAGLQRPGSLNRLFLHASELVIQHPDDNKQCEFSAPLDSLLEIVLRDLKPV